MVSNDIKKTLAVVEHASSAFGDKADDREKLFMGIVDGIEAGLDAADNPDLVAEEILGRMESIQEQGYTERDYILGLFIGSLSVPRLLVKPEGDSDV